jgi:hypothetical protein
MPSHPETSEQWQKISEKIKELTAAGTVQVFHLIPYYGFIPEWNKHTIITLANVNINYYANRKKRKTY